MALQGDLKSFALPDVLRLLAGTGKSGRLEIEGELGAGEVVLADGRISSASVTSAPRATAPSDVLFDLLRFEEGSFSFDEGEVADPGVRADVDAAIGAAERLVAEWDEVEAVVPSMEAWVALAPEIDGDTVTLTSGEWRALANVGGGGTVTDLATALELSDLDACRQVKSLVEAALVTVHASHGYVAPTVELDDFEQFEPVPAAPMTDLEELTGEDRSVLMEESEDALLPEPLPGEGIAYDGEAITGVVDGRTFETTDSYDQVDRFEPFESLASFEEEAAMSSHAGEPGTIDRFGSINPYSAIDPTDPAMADPAPAPVEAYEAYDEPAVPTMVAPAAAADEVDEERGSLLKFLSTVKP